jgi:mRNA interferase YafQ
VFTLIPTHQFKKDVKRVLKRSHDNHLLITEFLEKLERNGVEALDRKHNPHKLSGNYKDNWEAHIKPDLLVIWFEVTKNEEITLIRMGTHADLF